MRHDRICPSWKSFLVPFSRMVYSILDLQTLYFLKMEKIRGLEGKHRLRTINVNLYIIICDIVLISSVLILFKIN